MKLSSDKITALLYPTSFPKKRTRDILTSIFDQISLLMPNELTERTLKESLPEDDLIKMNTWMPVPLGERVEWFSQLMRDWAAWAQSMGLGQNVSASGILDAFGSQSKETVDSIVHSLKGALPKDPVLEAQITLHLAFEMDLQDEMLDKELSMITDQEKTLKQILQGPMIELRGRSKENYAIPTLQKSKERLHAWAILWSAAQKESVQIPVGESIEIKDIIDSAYESVNKGASVIDIMKLSVPPQICLDSGLRSRLREKLAEILEIIPHAKDAFTKVPLENIVSAGQAIENKWNELLGDAGPCPQLCLTIYPETPWEKLLLTGANCEEAEVTEGGLTPFSFYLI